MTNKISWCDATWNPVWGCNNKCEYCYARGIAKRFGEVIARNNNIPADRLQAFLPTWIESNYKKEFKKKDEIIFVNSMSDVMYWDAKWVKSVLDKIEQNKDKTFMILTKGKDGLFQVADKPTNCKVGITATTADEVFNRTHNYYDPKWDFISIEPIHERIRVVNLLNFNYVIVGAETGNRKNKTLPKAEWINEIKDFCLTYKIRYHEKDSLQNIVNRPLIQDRIV